MSFIAKSFRKTGPVACKPGGTMSATPKGLYSHTEVSFRIFLCLLESRRAGRGFRRSESFLWPMEVWSSQLWTLVGTWSHTLLGFCPLFAHFFLSLLPPLWSQTPLLWPGPLSIASSLLPSQPLSHLFLTLQQSTLLKIKNQLGRCGAVVEYHGSG